MMSSLSLPWLAGPQRGWRGPGVAGGPPKRLHMILGVGFIFKRYNIITRDSTGQLVQLHMILGGFGPRNVQDGPFLVPTSPNPGLEAAAHWYH